MNIAFIIGGWYFPKHLYKNAIEINKPEGSNIDYFTVTHRNPELVDIKSEMIPRIANKNKYDLELFNDIATYSDLIEMGYKVDEVENAIGDYYFFNQWAELYDYNKYDYIVFMHDDNYLLPEFKDIDATEIAQIEAHFKEKFDIPQENIEAAIESSLSIIQKVLGIIQEVIALIDSLKQS